mgnify:CR=1 FL=1
MRSTRFNSGLPQLFERSALQGRGREVVYLRYEDEGHGLVRLANRIDAYPQVAAFLERTLLA